MGPKKLKVSLARPPSIEIRNCKLYITNLPKEFSEREVTELFTQVRCKTPNFKSSHVIILVNGITTIVHVKESDNKNSTCQFGEIIECRVLKDRNLKSNKGVAFVQFNLKSQADNGKIF